MKKITLIGVATLFSLFSITAVAQTRQADCEIQIARLETEIEFIKTLLNPTAYIYNNTLKYKGSSPIAKSFLINAYGIKAEVEYPEMTVNYQVLGFDMTFFDAMGNPIIRTSSSNQFTDSQIEIMRKMSKGKIFYISRIRVKGHDGIEKILSPIEVIVD